VQLRLGTRRIRPFSESAKVRNRCVSRPLQRAVVDFAADVPFAQAMDKLVEHYGVLLSESAIRRTTLRHAEKMYESTEYSQQWPQSPGAEYIIAETDGGMVPIMEPDTEQADQRKGKVLLWKEAKISLAHAQGNQSPTYGGTLQGDAQQSGEILFDCASQAGFGSNTQLHAVGDGARWIANQVDEKFGENGRYLIDFWHVCEYLAAASKAIYPSTEEEAKSWVEKQKECLKNNQVDTVLSELIPHCEPLSIDDAQATVRVCYRYLNQRQDQLFYQEAMSRDLPIGSGEIESAHRYLVQQRLKRSGAWWRIGNAEHMLSLRIHRANHLWQDYWEEQSKLAA